MRVLYRNTKEKKIAGICAGIGEIYMIDPNIVRVIAVFVTVITWIWPGIIAYLVGWFLIPEKEEAKSGNDTAKKR